MLSEPPPPPGGGEGPPGSHILALILWLDKALNDLCQFTDPSLTSGMPETGVLDPVCYFSFSFSSLGCSNGT